MENNKLQMDLDSYVERTRNGPCFICKLVEGDPIYHHHIIYEDNETIIFLNKFPTQRGYSIVSPKLHIEDLTEELKPEQYFELQRKVHLTARALKREFDAERIYILSLGSQQGNSHIHWHVCPLPKGVPYHQQQYYALMAENGILALAEDEMSKIAKNVAACYQSLAGE